MGKTKLPSGTWIERDMFESKAFIYLKGFAPQLLILFLAKRKFQKHGRNGKEKRVCVNCKALSLTYIEAQNKYGITKSRFSRAIGELLAKGFITIIHHGGSYKQDKTKFGLIDKWMRWQPGMIFETRKKQNVQRGFCKPKTKVTRENVPIHSHENIPIEEVLG